MNTRSVNTSSKVDFGKNKRSEERLKVYKINFLIIRELFNLIKDKRISNSNFYSYIFDMDESHSEITMTSIVNTGYGNIKKYSKKLIEYGLSEEYFSKDNPEYIQAHDDLINLYVEYIDMGDKFVPDPYHEKRKSGEFDFNKLTKEEKKAEYKRDEIREENRDHRQYMRMTLMENIFSIKNKDNSLVIDCLRNMILDYLEVNKVSMPKLYDICAHLVSTKATTYLSQKQIKNYYIDAVSNFLNP